MANEQRAESPRARVEAFFEEQLPKVIAARPDAFASSKGVLTIIVEGAGSWTLMFGAKKDAIVDEGDPDADCMAVWLLPAFAALLSGETAIAAIRPVAVVGDEKLLGRLGVLLQPATRGGVGARLASLAA